MSERGMISKEFAEKVRASADIVKIISGYVSLKRKGDRYWGCCPFHNEKTPSFSVKPDDGFFYCFGCHAGGNVFKFISMHENVPYYEAVARVAEELNIPLPRKEQTPAQIAREKHIDELRQVNQLAGNFFHNCLTMTVYGKKGLAYFRQRGIDEETIKEFSLGFAPDAWDKLSSAFVQRGIAPELLVECDLARQRQEGGLYDRFRNRVMIPIRDDRGRIVGFGGRIIEASAREQAKYLNSRETVLFNKRRLLFGLDKAYRHIEKAGFSLVVEGYMDVISVYAAGIKNVVASLGTAFTREQCRKLLRYAPEIYFCYDSDAAGQNAIFRAIDVASEMENAVIRVVQMPDGKDPDEFIRKHGADAFRQVVRGAVPMVEFQLQYIVKDMDLNSLESRLQAMARILPVLSGVRNLVQRNAYVARAAQILGVAESELSNELERQNRGRYGGYQSQPAGSARPVLRRADDALRRAGRVVIRAVWQEPVTLEHFVSMVPLDAVPDEVQAAVLRQMALFIRQGERLTDVMQFASLGEQAVEELSRALVEEQGQQDLMELYGDCVKLLRKNYLHGQFELHRLKADRLSREGMSGYLEELALSQKIKNEMDEL
ncbi:DNA primase [Anaerovibrio sp.]|uniref:DNA primase n=1 Tax=Anaerovibrio sp. TaxID=1872532 RepID=UPI003F1506F5